METEKKKNGKKVNCVPIPIYFQDRGNINNNKKENFQKNWVFSKQYFEKLLFKHREKTIFYLSI